MNENEEILISEESEEELEIDEEGEEGEEEEVRELEGGGELEVINDLQFVQQIVNLTNYTLTKQINNNNNNNNNDITTIPSNIFPSSSSSISSHNNNDNYDNQNNNNNNNNNEEEEESDEDDDEKEDFDEDKDMIISNEIDEDEHIPIGPLKTIHEVIEEIPIVKIDVDIPDNETISLIGEVLSHIIEERTIVIQSVKTTTPLDEGSLLCLENKIPIGKVNEIFGPLGQPFYVVRGIGQYSKQKKIEKDEEEKQQEEKEEVEVEEKEELIYQLVPGTKIYCPTGMTSFVTPLSISNVMKNSKRPTDASNLYDEEPDENEMPEFSDDEQEQEWKRQQKEKKNAKLQNSSNPDKHHNQGRKQKDRRKGEKHTNQSLSSQSSLSSNTLQPTISPPVQTIIYAPYPPQYQQPQFYQPYYVPNQQYANYSPTYLPFPQPQPHQHHHQQQHQQQQQFMYYPNQQFYSPPPPPPQTHPQSNPMISSPQYVPTPQSVQQSYSQTPWTGYAYLGTQQQSNPQNQPPK